MLPRTRRGRILAAGAFLDSVTTGLYLAVAVLYFVGFVGISGAAVGVVIALANLCGLASPLPVARLTRRLGVVRVYLALLLVRGMCFATYAVVDGYAGYLVVTCVMTAAGRAATPLLQVIVGQLEGEADRTRTMASLRVVNNIGLTAGFLVAAAVQLAGSRVAFAVLFVCCGLAFAGVAAMTVAATGRQALSAPMAPPVRKPRGVYRDRGFLAMAAANAVLLLHDSMLFILLPLWVVERCGLSPTASSILLMVNTVLTVVMQVYVSRFATGVRNCLRLLGFAVLALGVACVLLGLADDGTPVVLVYLGLAVVLLTVGENLHAVAGWELSYRLADPPLRAQYLSLFSLGVTAQMIVGPVLMTSVVLPWGMPGVLAMGALFVAATAVTYVVVRAHPRASAERELAEVA